MSKKEGVPPPNYTQTPNILLDVLMLDMGEAELKVTLAIVRQTFGWHKDDKQLSLTTLMRLTKLTKQGVLNGLAAGMERGTIRRTETGTRANGTPIYSYEFIVNEVDHTERETVNEVDRQSQKMVNDVDYIKRKSTEKERTTERKRSARPPRTFELLQSANGSEPKPTVTENPKPKQPGEDAPAVQVFREIFGPLRLSVPQLEHIAESVPRARLDDWRQTCKEWQLSGWSPTNIHGMIDRFLNPPPPKRGKQPKTLPPEPPRLSPEELRELNRKLRELNNIPPTEARHEQASA